MDATRFFPTHDNLFQDLFRLGPKGERWALCLVPPATWSWVGPEGGIKMPTLCLENDMRSEKK